MAKLTGYQKETTFSLMNNQDSAREDSEKIQIPLLRVHSYLHDFDTLELSLFEARQLAAQLNAYVDKYFFNRPAPKGII
jgi:hypothetical protein